MMMHLSSKKSVSGKRAYPPNWWVAFNNAIPKLFIPALEPKEWTREKAQWWVKFVPPKCPFERQFWINDTLILYIPPICPLNPLSAQLFSIRLAAQTYLANYENN